MLLQFSEAISVGNSTPCRADAIETDLGTNAKVVRGNGIPLSGPDCLFFPGVRPAIRSQCISAIHTANFERAGKPSASGKCCKNRHNQQNCSSHLSFSLPHRP